MTSVVSGRSSRYLSARYANYTKQKGGSRTGIAGDDERFCDYVLNIYNSRLEF